MESEQPCDVIEAEKTFFKLLISCNDFFLCCFIREIADFFSFSAVILFFLYHHSPRFFLYPFLLSFIRTVANSSGKLKSVDGAFANH
jgi:hypothetical protein